MLEEHFGPKNKWLLIHQAFRKSSEMFGLERIAKADCRRNERQPEFNSFSLPNQINDNETTRTMLWRLLIKLPWPSFKVTHQNLLRFTHTYPPAPAISSLVDYLLHLMCVKHTSHRVKHLVRSKPGWMITVFTSNHVYVLRFLLIM